MSGHWLVYIMIVAVAFILYLVCGKLLILKSKSLGIFAIILISTIICWVIYDFLIASE